MVGGSTGAGKSTLVNCWSAHRVTEPGVLRPTTRSPVLVHHPDDARWFGQDRLLPDLERVGAVHQRPRGPPARRLRRPCPPDWRSSTRPTSTPSRRRNRTLAAQLLAAADLWLFVTSAARYADQVPWDFLRKAAERRAAVAIVLDRTPDEAVETVSTHLARMLASRGLKDSPLFIVREGKVNDEGLLPPEFGRRDPALAESLAGDTAARAAVVRQTLDGAIRTSRGAPTASQTRPPSRPTPWRGCATTPTRPMTRPPRAVTEASADGTLLRGEVLARWQEFVGTGELLALARDHASAPCATASSTPSRAGRPRPSG